MHPGPAFQLLTRIPVPVPDDCPPNHAAWVYPVVGLVLGALVCLLGYALQHMGLSSIAVAGIILGGLMVLTGAMHEDGLADCADGLWGGWTKERRLAIMKDSSIGAYGVCALIVVIGLRWHGLAMLIETHLYTLIGILAFSRGILPAIMCYAPSARPNGLAAAQRKPPVWSMAGAVVIGSISLVVLAPSLASGVVMLGLGLIIAALMVLIAHRKIGGITGDVLGAIVMIVETVAMVAL